MPSHHRSERNVIAVFLLDITKIIAILLCIIAFIGYVGKVPSPSMEPTLLVGDYVIINKISYGYGRGSFLLWKMQLPFPELKKRVFAFKRPNYGDVFAFRTANKSDNKTYVKRLIGMPGDKVEVKDGYVYINDQKCDVEDIGEVHTATETLNGICGNSTRTVVSKKYLETLPNGYKHILIKRFGFGAQTGSRYDNCGPFYVPDGCYFAMGDNRDDSTDSRVQEIIGFVKDCNIVGSVVMVAWHLKCKMWQIYKIPFSARCDRFFKRVK